jgi:uncharacterized protein (DUF433 family)
MEPNSSENQDSSATVGTLPVIREHIVSTPEMCGGKPRIAGSRIQVRHVVVMHERQGMTPLEIVSEYPRLTLAGVYAALAYDDDHTEEVSADIQAEQEWREEIKGKHASRLEEKLEARKPNASDDTLSQGSQMPRTIRFHIDGNCAGPIATGSHRSHRGAGGRQGRHRLYPPGRAPDQGAVLSHPGRSPG